MRRTALVVLAACLLPASGPIQIFGQSVVSVRSGLINYSEGDVLINGQPLQRRFGTYVSLKAGSDLVTREGRAELLLTPNAYLRVGAESAIRMVADGLADTRVELLGGSAVLDSSGAPGNTPLTITLNDSSVRFVTPGKFRLDSDPPQLRVYEGDAEVQEDGKTVKVAPAQLLPLHGAPIVRAFTDGSDGALDLWSDERHTMIAANLDDAQHIGNPLTDPDPDPTMAGNYGYPGYIPMLGYPGVVGPYPGGVYPTLGYGMPGYGMPGYNPYGIYSPYSPYGVYGGLGIYSPLYLRTARPSGVVTYPSGFGGLRPGGIVNGVVTPSTIHSLTTPYRPATVVRPGARIGAVGGHR